MDEATKQARLGRITSSVAASALGLNLPESSPIDAWLAITGRSRFDGNKATERGIRLEDVALQYGAEMVGAHSYHKPKYRPHPVHEWAGDSCDAIYLDEWKDPIALGEAKTVALGSAEKFGMEDTQEVPPKVEVQCHWHMIHYPEAPYVLVPVLVGGYEFEFRKYHVARDEERQGLLLQDLEKWHRDYVVADKMPPVTYADTEYVQSLYPQDNGQFLEADEQMDQLAEEVLKAKEARKAAEKTEDLLCNQLRLLLAEHVGIKGNGYSVTYRNNNPSMIVPWQKVALAAGADKSLIDSLTYEKPGNRPLIVKRPTMGKMKKAER